ncbi:acyltransferase [Candidatus Woesearchaeota archaeon]|nr:acyltransferase [Candidatus Woesearchaeota archaeon]
MNLAIRFSGDEKRIVVPYSGRHLNPAVEWYKLGNPVWMAFRAACNEILRHCVLPSGFKNSCYRLLGVKIGKDVIIGPLVFIDPLFSELITIEDGAIIGGDVFISAHEFLANETHIGKVCIRKKAVVGIRCTIRSGVTIGRNSIVGICSYIGKDIGNNEFWGGVPARLIRRLEHE